ncbi:hypothetical protein Vretimale_15467 [Volvox reticuliferus]|uniref:NAD(P)-binding domain-containing protein n=1 Tax=Volvox reticuliferus TaxID=1737510 RepID=A0A8J4FZJ8_9CHLO|nr:hypothetical protein Vretifemale_20446 [Volvox reticuliferus]GIM12011.1 hypothetical protein Vretimale_15467 [Volvox reticuliferus]
MQALTSRRGVSRTNAPIPATTRTTGKLVAISQSGSSRRPRIACAATLGLDQIPIEALAAGGVALAGIIGAITVQMQQQSQASGGDAALANAADGAEVVPPPPPPPPRENAVLVLGATGRLGRRVVAKLLAAGRTVVAGSRTLDKARDVLLGSGEGRMGLREGFQDIDRSSGGILFLEQVDITNPESLTRPGLWEGVQQVVLTVGTVFGPLPEGGFGVLDGMTSERVEAEGISSLVSLLPKLLPKKATRTSNLVLPMHTAEQLDMWQKLDDVIMGGASNSGLEVAPEGAGVMGAVWRGNLVVEGGGFCGTRTRKLDLNLGDQDGVHLRLLGDGQTFKLNIKTIDQEDIPESTYQATFDTVAGQWTDVYLPWHNFVPVKRAQSDPDDPPLDPSRISKLGLVLSRFEFNKLPNQDYKPGPFELLIEGGIRAYQDVRPQLVMISSAGVERNAIIGDDAVRRAADIPIVQLNPNGTLNHKYTAEIAVRSSGYPYSVVRSTGMIDSSEGGPYLLQADQGDEIVGQISRDEVAECLAMAINMPEATGKTFELRRNEAAESKGKRPMGQKDYVRLFLKLALDKQRWRVGLRPMPKAVPPPAPVSEERRKEIVAQVAVIRGQQQPTTTAAATVQPRAGDGANGSTVISATSPPPPAADAETAKQEVKATKAVEVRA